MKSVGDYVCAIMLVFLVLWALIGCAHMQGKGAEEAIPRAPVYSIPNLLVGCPTQGKFNEIVKEKLGEEYLGIEAFTVWLPNSDYSEWRPIIFIPQKPDGSIDLYWLGHEVFFHVMEYGIDLDVSSGKEDFPMRRERRQTNFGGEKKMNVLDNDDKITSQIFEDYKKASKEADEALQNVFAKKIKGFQFFQEEHKNRFKITKK